ncbi:hypothetical protein BC941DRAFT_507996 [Chlamydoabsidia padenii]|nr:hypothetical protein BC941DRAFT_507996 [Chlamydoabsidia padenii]
MAEYQPMSIPSNYYDATATNTPTPSSFEFMEKNNNKDTRKRKQRVSTTEPYFTDYQWEAPPSTDTPNQHNNDDNTTDKNWSSPMENTTTFNNSTHQQVHQSNFSFDQFHQATPSFFNEYQQPYSSKPSGQQQTYSHQLKPTDQQVSDPLQSLLQSQELGHRSFPEAHTTSWNSTLPSNQSPSSSSTTTTTTSTYRPSSHPTLESINQTSFSTDGFLDSLSDERTINTLIKFDTIPATLTSVKSSHPLASPDNHSDGDITLLASQQYPTSGVTISGSTPPSSSPMTSTHSSPAITPVYGRLSNLSLRQPTPIYQQQDSLKKNNDIDIMMTINERYTPSTGLDYATLSTPRNLHSTARTIQQQQVAARLQPIIHHYLASKDPTELGEKTVVIMSCKVAQKSYGTEKRFLCPPPTAILVGSTWWSETQTNSNENEMVFQQGHGDTSTKVIPPKITVSISGESSSQPGQIEWYSQANGAVVGQTGFVRQTIDPGSNNNTRFRSHSSTETRNHGGDWYHNPRVDPIGGGRCVSKQLYINDADEKRKRVECLVKIQIQGQWLGTLAGKGIKVISKPSKKRQSVKNIELCIHHGSVVSLFNRIRSQTVSTKYLGVSNGTDAAFTYPGQLQTDQTKTNDATCFVARTTSWDPFVIWLVDTSQTSLEQQQQQQQSHTFSGHAEDYIGHRAFKPSVNYPPPPAIALRNTTHQPLAIHYNQHVVLQCLTTGLVSPVMIIRKVDKASTVVGGARSVDEPLMTHGGEYGDEILGDPVSQLHKIALQIVQNPSQINRQQQQQQQHPYHQTNHHDLTSGLMENMLPRYNSPVTYLACLNDMVGMHRSTDQRQPILKTPPPPPPHQPASFTQEEVIEEDGRVVRKRKVSAYSNPLSSTQPLGLSDAYNKNGGGAYGASPRRRVNSYDEYGFEQQLHGSSSTSILTTGGSVREDWTGHRSRSLSTQDHRQTSSTGWINGPLGGAYWYEDVSDAAVWTLVGTDIASYTFLPTTDVSRSTPYVFPHLSHYTLLQDDILHLHGENLARDLQVWLGDIRAPHVEYKSRELVVCRLPPRQQLMECPFIESYPTSSLSSVEKNKMVYQLPLLLVKAADGIVHKSSIYYQV